MSRQVITEFKQSLKVSFLKGICVTVGFMKKCPLQDSNCQWLTSTVKKRGKPLPFGLQTVIELEGFYSKRILFHCWCSQETPCRTKTFNG